MEHLNVNENIVGIRCTRCTATDLQSDPNPHLLLQDIAEPLFDLKLGMDQLSKNQTFKRILAALLAIGNFLNSSNVRSRSRSLSSNSSFFVLVLLSPPPPCQVLLLVDY